MVTLHIEVIANFARLPYQSATPHRLTSLETCQHFQPESRIAGISTFPIFLLLLGAIWKTNAKALPAIAHAVFDLTWYEWLVATLTDGHRHFRAGRRKVIPAIAEPLSLIPHCHRSIIVTAMLQSIASCAARVKQKIASSAEMDTISESLKARNFYC